MNQESEAAPQQLNLRQRLAAWFMGVSHEQFASVVSTQIKKDTPGFYGLGRNIYDRPFGQAQQFYMDALEAWRENPHARRVIDIVTDYILGDGITITSDIEPLDAFISLMRGHRKNRELLIETERLVDELTRAGDVFLALWRNPADGLSYIRAIPKERIEEIHVAENDPDEELGYYLRPDYSVGNVERVRWPSPNDPEADSSDVVMLHYAVNRPIGARFGESDLGTVLKWIKRYSDTLQGRVRLHWATRLFYWIVKVPRNFLTEKQKAYAQAPPEGSIIVTDEKEEWEVMAPDLKGLDASYDLGALRQMIYTGVGFPGIWMGESGSSNLAEAKEMRGPAERHLQRRQNFVIWMLSDIYYHAYLRALRIGKVVKLPEEDYSKLFQVNVTEISREDNTALAVAGADMARAMSDFIGYATHSSMRHTPKLLRRIVSIWFKFIGEPQKDADLDVFLNELGKASAEAQALAESIAAGGDNDESSAEDDDSGEAADDEENGEAES